MNSKNKIACFIKKKILETLSGASFYDALNLFKTFVSLIFEQISEACQQLHRLKSRDMG